MDSWEIGEQTTEWAAKRLVSRLRNGQLRDWWAGYGMDSWEIGEQATEWATGKSHLISCRSKRFLFSKYPRPALGSTQAPLNWYRLSPDGGRSDHSHSPRAKDRNDIIAYVFMVSELPGMGSYERRLALYCRLSGSRSDSTLTFWNRNFTFKF